MSHRLAFPSRRAPSRRAPLAVLAAALLALLVLVPAGASQAEESGSTLPPGKAWVRVGHFVPGMGTTSVELTPLGAAAAEPITLAGDAAYGQVTSYDKLVPGSYTATVRETSADADAEPLLSRSFEITAGAARTVAVVGTASAPRLALLTDDLTPPAAGTARVRVLSASEAAASVTVTAVDGPTIAEGAVLGQATDYVTVPAGEWTLQLQSEIADATLQEVPIASGSVYTVVALDAGDGQVELQVVTDAAGATVAPQGGAETGLGGAAATSGTGATAPVLTALVATMIAAMIAATGLVRRRRLALVGR